MIFYIIRNTFRNSKLSLIIIQLWKPWLHCAWCSSCLRQNCTLCASVSSSLQGESIKCHQKATYKNSYKNKISLTISWLLNHFFSRGHLPVLGVGVLEQANHWGPHLPLGLPALPHIRFWKSKVLVCEDFRSHLHAHCTYCFAPARVQVCEISNTFAHSHFRTYNSAPDRTQAFAHLHSCAQENVRMH